MKKKDLARLAFEELGVETSKDKIDTFFRRRGHSDGIEKSLFHTVRAKMRREQEEANRQQQQQQQQPQPPQQQVMKIEIVRKLLEENPNLQTKEVVGLALRNHGVAVAASAVRQARRQMGIKSPSVKETNLNVAPGFTLGRLLKVKEVATELGGIDQLKNYLNQLESLQI